MDLLIAVPKETVVTGTAAAGVGAASAHRLRHFDYFLQAVLDRPRVSSSSGNVVVDEHFALNTTEGGSVRKSKIVEISTILEVAISGVKRISCIAKRIWPLLGRIWPDHGVRSVAFAEVRR